MVRTTGKSLQGDKNHALPDSAEYEALVGRIVIEMLRSGKLVNRASLCARVAFLMSESPQPSQDIVYEKLLRLLLSSDR